MTLSFKGLFVKRFYSTRHFLQTSPITSKSHKSPHFYLKNLQGTFSFQFTTIAIFSLLPLIFPVSPSGQKTFLFQNFFHRSLSASHFNFLNIFFVPIRKWPKFKLKILVFTSSCDFLLQNIWPREGRLNVCVYKFQKFASPNSQKLAKKPHLNFLN